MEYYGNKLCVSYKELIDGGIMSVPNYKAMSSRGRFDVVRRGNRSRCALLTVCLRAIAKKCAVNIRMVRWCF